MRFLAIILSVLILALTIMPCADKAPSESGELVITAVHQDAAADHHNDDCSPLCICHCCNTVVINSEIQFFETPVENEYFPENTLYRIAVPANPYYSIWEPPKIA